MPKFNPRRILFGLDGPPADADQVAGEDDFQDIPTPALIRHRELRLAGIREAHEALANLPQPGESLHAIVTARLDLTDVINALLEKLGPVDGLMMATLGFNERNLNSMERWYDSGRAKSMTLVASLFLRAHKGWLWEKALASFRGRGQRAACCHSHAKVVTMAFASGGKLSIEGSANLCGNGSGREQFALINDASLHDWHASWIDTLVSKHGEGEEASTD